MSPTTLASHADLLRRLDELPISAHDRQVAQAQARLAFGIVDAVCDGMDVLRGWVAGWRRQPPRPRRAH